MTDPVYGYDRVKAFFAFCTLNSHHLPTSKSVVLTINFSKMSHQCFAFYIKTNGNSHKISVIELPVVWALAPSKKECLFPPTKTVRRCSMIGVELSKTQLNVILRGITGCLLTSTITYLRSSVWVPLLFA